MMTRRTLRGLSRAGLILAALASAPAAAAQICIGIPSGNGRPALATNVGFPRDATALTLEASYNAPEPVSVFAAFSWTRWDETAPGQTDREFRTVALGAAYEISEHFGPLPAGLSLCPATSATYTRHRDFSVFSAPFGFGVGATLPIAGGQLRLMPYAIPQLVYQTTNYRGTGAQPALPVAGSRTDFGLEAGGLIGYGMLWGGVGINALFPEGGSESVLKLKLGVSF